MSALAILMLALAALFTVSIALAMMVEAHREYRRRNPPPARPFDVPAEWANLEQREYLGRIFTPRFFVALVVVGLGLIGPLLALLFMDGRLFFELWVDDTAWLAVPEWWFLAIAGSPAVSTILVMMITRGHLCAECRGRLHKWTSPPVQIPGARDARGRRVLLMCPSCQFVYRAPWHVWVTGGST